MDLKETLKAYIEKQIEADVALRSVYAASKMDACAKYVTEQARIELKGISGYVEDAQVFKWARDFYLEGHAEKAAESKPAPNTVKPVQKKEPESTPSPVQKATRKQKNTMDNQPMLFDFLRTEGKNA